MSLYGNHADAENLIRFATNLSRQDKDIKAEVALHNKVIVDYGLSLLVGEKPDLTEQILKKFFKCLDYDTLDFNQEKFTAWLTSAFVKVDDTPGSGIVSRLTDVTLSNPIAWYHRNGRKFIFVKEGAPTLSPSESTKFRDSWHHCAFEIALFAKSIVDQHVAYEGAEYVNT